MGLVALIAWLAADRRTLDVLLGRPTAVCLGVAYDREVRRTMVVIALLLCVSTALVGPITFFGLLVAHLAYRLAGSHRHAYTLPMAALCAIVTLVGGQAIVQHLLDLGHRPVGGGGTGRWTPSHHPAHRGGQAPVISIDRVSKRYADRLVLDTVTVDLSAGGVTCLIGSNGAGKSTLLSIMARLLGADAGTVVGGGLDVTTADTRELARTMAVLRQETHLTVRLTVLDLVSFGRFPRNGGRPTPVDRQAVEEAIAWYASCWADSILALREGRVVAHGSPETIMDTEVLQGIYGCSIPVHTVDGRRLAMYCA